MTTNRAPRTGRAPRTLTATEAGTGRRYTVVEIPAADGKFARPLATGGFRRYNLVKRYV